MGQQKAVPARPTWSLSAPFSRPAESISARPIPYPVGL